MNKKVLILLAVVWTAALGLVGFSELRPEGSPEPTREAASTGPAEPESAGKESGEQASSGRQTAAGSAGGSEVGSGEAGPEGVTLQLRGEPGLEYTGRCVVDGEERELDGRTPESYTYEPEERLECEISSRDRGSLRVTFSDGEGTDTVQQVGPRPGTVELDYTGDSLSTSTNSVVQTNSSQVISSQKSSQSVSSQSSGTSSAQSSQSGSQVSSSQSSYQSSSSVVRSESE